MSFVENRHAPGMMGEPRLRNTLGSLWIAFCHICLEFVWHLSDIVGQLLDPSAPLWGTKCSRLLVQSPIWDNWSQKSHPILGDTWRHFCAYLRGGGWQNRILNARQLEVAIVNTSGLEPVCM